MNDEFADPQILKSLDPQIPRSPQVRLVVFDLDGTLIDSRRDLAESMNEVLAEYGAAPLAEAAIGRMVGDGAAQLVRRALDASGLAPDADALARFLAVYNARPLRHTRPYSGVPEVLAALEPRAALAVLTNKPLHATREILAGLELSSYFPAEHVRGGDGPLPRKPDPSGLLSLAADGGVAIEQVLMVGDSFVDWRTARAAGSAVCLARWGYGFETFPLHELRPGDRVIDRPTELLEIA